MPRYFYYKPGFFEIWTLFENYTPQQNYTPAATKYCTPFLLLLGGFRKNYTPASKKIIPRCVFEAQAYNKLIYFLLYALIWRRTIQKKIYDTQFPGLQ